MRDYDRIAAVIRYLDSHQAEQPDLATLAAQSGLSRFHFHRLFSRWAGITPKDFLQCLTLSHAGSLLAAGRDVLQSALDAGLSGPGRLHDLCVHLEAASPGEIALGGAGWTIRAGFVESPFGLCLAGESPRGICHLSFEESSDRELAAETIRAHWPRANLQWDDTASSQLVAPLFRRPGDRRAGPPLRAFVRGTEFQVRVWRALLDAPPNCLLSYGELAVRAGSPPAARAVGGAVGRNPLAFLIPCHRVIRATGATGHYRWGETRKKAMLVWESSGWAADSWPLNRVEG